MASQSKISGITSIGYDSSRIEPVRRHTPEEVEAIYKNVEGQEKDRAEIRAYLAKFPNPNHLSFSELLAQNKAGPQSNDDEGYVLDIGNK